MQNETLKIDMFIPQPYLSSNNMLAKLQKHFDWSLLSQRKGIENVQSAAKLFKHLRHFVPKNLYLMQFCQ